MKIRRCAVFRSPALLALAAFAVPAQAAPPTSPLDYYPDLFAVEVVEAGGRSFVARKVLATAAEHPLAALVADHAVFLGYLLDFGSAISPDELDRRKDRPDELATYFAEALRRDEIFHAAMLPLLARALAAQGLDVEGFSPPPRRTVALDHAMNVAVRFFYPDRAGENGMTGHICSGINGLADAPWERDPALEALAFAAIRRDLATGERAIQREFLAAMKRALALDLSADLETRVKRAQGAVWAQLSRSDHLRELILGEYERMKSLLPFELDATAPPDVP